MKRVPRTLRRAILLLALLLIAVPSLSQTNLERAGARAAAEQGLDAFDAGHYAKAIDLLERAEAIVHAPIHLLYIARAHEALGKLVQARETYIILLRENLTDDAHRVSKESRAAGEEELERLEPRLPYVEIVITGVDPERVQVTRNGQAVPAPLVGVPHPINPGEYEFRAATEGFSSTPVKVAVTEGERKRVELSLVREHGELNSKAGPGGLGSTSETVPAQSSATSSLVSGSADQSGITPLQTGAIGGFTVAAVGAGVGAYFLVQSGATRDEADDVFSRCGNDGCADPADPIRARVETLDSRAVQQTNVAIASLIVGGLGLTAGAVFLLLDQSSEEETNAGITLTPWIGAGVAGVSGGF